MKIDLTKCKRVIISRTDAIGDVVLTLPLASKLKELSGGRLDVGFFGKTYTYPVINSCVNIDRFYNYDTFSGFDEKGKTEFIASMEADAFIHVFPREEIANAVKRAGIVYRIGTTHRLYHWWTCNHLVKLGRKNSSLHEAQLNMFLLKDFGLKEIPNTKVIGESYGMKRFESLPERIFDLLQKDKFKLILHPKSNVSAREWSLSHFTNLIRFLGTREFQFIVTGTADEALRMKDWLGSLPVQVVNLTGALSLDDLIALIHQCNGLVAASTGPLHLAAAMGKRAMGIYPPIRPMHPGRWAPLGPGAEFQVINKSCSECRSKPLSCHCMNEIDAASIAEKIRTWL